MARHPIHMLSKVRPSLPPDSSELFVQLEHHYRHQTQLHWRSPSDNRFCTHEAVLDNDNSMMLAVLALSGSTSPLPGYYLEAWQGAGFSDSATRMLLELIQRHLLALLHRGWRKYRYWLPTPEATEHAWLRVWRGWLGIGNTTLTDATPLWPLVRVLLSGASREAIQYYLQQLPGLAPLRLENGARRRVPLPDDVRLRLGVSQLGHHGVLGGYQYTSCDHIRCRLVNRNDGDWPHWQAQGAAAEMMLQQLRRFTLGALSIEWYLSLAEHHRRQGRLGARWKTRLGWNCHLGRPHGLAIVGFRDEGVNR